MKTLNILNGDSTAFTFKQTGLSGDLLIWRELLAEGPVSISDLWTIRLPWMIENFGATAIDYQKMVIDEASKLGNLTIYDRIILWFEFDLVCQINLIYILSQLNKNQSIFLICPDHFEGLSNFRGLGELNPMQLASLEPSKIKLTEKDLAFASMAWGLYVENDVSKIKAFLASDFGSLPLLKPALEAHLSRLQPINYIEKLLQKIIASGVTKKEELYAQFWDAAPIFGMGDSQIDYYLKRLQQ